MIRHGYLVLEANVEPFTIDTRHTINSATKSVVSALVGIAMTAGKIKSLDQKMVDFFPDVAIKNLDAAKKSDKLRLNCANKIIKAMEWISACSETETKA